MSIELYTWATRKAKAEGEKGDNYFGILISPDRKVIWESEPFYMNRRWAAQAAVDEARRRGINLDKPIGYAGVKGLPKRRA